MAAVLPSRRVASAVLAVLLTTGLSGCYSSGGNQTQATNMGTTQSEPADNATGPITTSAAPTATASAAASPVKVSITRTKTDPASVTVQPGQRIQITNDDSVNHSLRDSAHNLSTGPIQSGRAASLVAPAQAGTFRLSDPKQPDEQLTVVVT